MTKLYYIKTASALSATILLVASAAGLADQSLEKKQVKTPSALQLSKHRSQAHQISAEKKRQLVKEAVETVMETENALTALYNHNTEQSLHYLQDVSAKLRILSSRDSKFNLIPVSFQEETVIYQGNLDDVKATTKKAMQLIEAEQIQQAKKLLAELASEIRINIVSLPLSEYPGAIDEATALIKAGKEDDAKKTLEKVLDTLVANTEIYPLPVLSAEADLTDAYELEHNSGLSKKDGKKQILQLADNTEYQLKLAEALGYGDKKDYATLYQGIQALRDTLHTDSDKFKETWEQVKGAIGSLKEKIIHPRLNV
ncbi:YfdX family protein [Methylomicrobium sp. Wu6]|uniref:YfdX family protein n=1 Tax=Methylomicrobium sp. Wu6 TaxID=3107928 RepID=UPI002DD65101|nr:YfdX family protein [Methylomicrobium sp. Wu6]MEC4750387.1 YfdX family protein [Methylomicrobium sp. Wu6]